MSEFRLVKEINELHEVSRYRIEALVRGPWWLFFQKRWIKIEDYLRLKGPAIYTKYSSLPFQSLYDRMDEIGFDSLDKGTKALQYVREKHAELNNLVVENKRHNPKVGTTVVDVNNND